jgi:hypothetical protein
LYEHWPIKTDEDLDKLTLKILVGVFKALKLVDRIDDVFSDHFLNFCQAIIKALLEDNEFCWKKPPDIINAKYLNAVAKLDPERLKIATEKLTEIFTILFRDFFPPTLFLMKEDETNSNDPNYFIDYIQEPENLLTNLYDVFLQLKHNNQPLFPQLYRQITDNVLLANGYTEDTYKSGKHLKSALEIKAAPVELARLFLKETTFDVLFCLPVSVPEPQMPPIPDHIRFEHTFVLAASGGGKTTKMYYDVLELLNRPDPASQVIIDPKGTVVQHLSRLACFDPVHGQHKDRLIIIDPSDFKAPPAFNVFKPANESRYNHYDQNTREALETQIIELLAYTFSSRKQSLTPKQGPCFEQVCRLLLRMPEPTITLLFDLLKDQQASKRQSFDSTKPEWKPYVARLPEFAARFFHEDYFTNYVGTRDEIVSRLYGLLGNPSIQRVFGAKHNKFDMFDALQTGKIVIVNVPLAFLGDQGAEMFGKYMIASTLAAAIERLTIPKSQWRPAFLHIDECQLFADDDKTTTLLALAREFKLGITMYTQVLDHFSQLMRSHVLTNTRIKYAARLKSDAGTTARAMGDCDPGILVRAAPDNARGVVKLAGYVDGLMDAPTIVEYPIGAIEREPQMSAETHELLLTRNRERVSRPAQPPSSPAQSSPPPSPPPPPPQASKGRQPEKRNDIPGALYWEVTINPRLAEPGGEMPVVVQRGDQPVKLNIKIPPLTENGTVVRLAGCGHFRSDKTRGDLYVTIKVQSYPEQNPSADEADKW